MSVIETPKNDHNPVEGVVRIGDSLVNLALVEHIELDGDSIVVSYDSGEEREWKFKDEVSAQRVFDSMSASCAARLFGQEYDLYPSEGNAAPSQLSNWGICWQLLKVVGGITAAFTAVVLTVHVFRHGDQYAPVVAGSETTTVFARWWTTVVLTLVYCLFALHGVDMILAGLLRLLDHFWGPDGRDPAA